MRRLAIILPYFLVFLIFFIPAVDTDLGWHLRYGEHILQTGEVMRTNKLTFLLPNYEWQYGNLYQILTAGIYRAGGLPGLALAYGILGVLIWLVFDLLTKKARPLNLPIFLGAVYLGWGVFKLGWRGQIFTILGILLTTLLLKYLDGSLKVLQSTLIGGAFAFSFAIWANFHGGFVLGLFLIGLWFLDEVIRLMRRRVTENREQIPEDGSQKTEKDAESTENRPNSVLRFLILSSVLPLSALAALLNPFSLNIYRESMKHATYPLNRLIAEWVAPPLSGQGLVVVITLIVIGLVVSTKSVKRKIFWGSSVLVFAYLAITARRSLPLFGLTAGLALLHSACQPSKVWLSNMKHPMFHVLWPLGITVAIMVVSITRVPRTVTVSTDWGKYCEAAQVKYPCGAAMWLKENPLDVQNIFNAYEWGGFLEWQLPRYKFFVDGRMPAWDRPSPYTTYLELIQAQDGYQEKLDNYGTEALFIQAGTFLNLKLQEEKDSPWQEVYRDKRAVIYTKQSR